MPRSQKNDNFIDKTFTIVADLLLKIIPTTQREKEAFTYYRDGVICLSIVHILYRTVLKFSVKLTLDRGLMTLSKTSRCVLSVDKNL